MSVNDKLTAVRTARKKRPAKILTIDIERLPGLAYAFDQKTKFIPARNFVQQPETVCFAARWYGQSRMIFESVWKDKQRMIERSWELYDEADAVITFNGRRFDNNHLRGAWLKADMPAPRPWKDIDLFTMAKGKFGFISNGLDHITRELGYTGKTMSYNIATTQAAVNGDKTAQRDLKTYNMGDVELTEWLYDRLASYLPTHPHFGQTDKMSCNSCGSRDLEEQVSNYKAVLLEYKLFRCNVCGSQVRGNFNVARVAVTRGVA